jgi:hypothetical protein
MERPATTVFALAALLAAGAACAEEPAQPVDEEFLEFLGTVDVDDEQWSEFLKAMEDEARIKAKEKATEAEKEKVKSDERP